MKPIIFLFRLIAATPYLLYCFIALPLVVVVGAYALCRKAFFVENMKSHRKTRTL